MASDDGKSGGSSKAGAPPRTAGSSTLDPLIGRTLLGRYEVLRRIGSGGMGSVYAGKQTAVGREVGLKVLRSDLLSNDQVRERFKREAEIIGKLRHPNTIQLIDYGDTDDGLAVMVMELLQGQALSDRLKQHGPLPILDALRVGQEVASSLSEAHSIGLVHRDLKPGNIFLVEVAGKTHAKVLDFGIARILDEEATRITTTGAVFGTPRYMSPEQGLASGEVDSRSDLYSLGLIIFECIAGQPPFVANTSIQYLSAHQTMPPPKLRQQCPTAPQELEDLIDRCLAKEREDRIQTADEVAERLRRISLRLEAGAEGAAHALPRGPSGAAQQVSHSAVSLGQIGNDPRTAHTEARSSTTKTALMPQKRPAGGDAAGAGAAGAGTGAAAPKPGSKVPIYAGIAVLVVAGVTYAVMRTPGGEKISAMDAGEMAASIDAGAAIAGGPTGPTGASGSDTIAEPAVPDAGSSIASAEEDAGTVAEGEGHATPKLTKETGHKEKRTKGTKKHVGSGVISEPAVVTMPGFEDSDNE